MNPIRTMTPAEAALWLSTETNPQFIDVRTPEEFSIASIPGSILIPMDEIATRALELDPDAPVLIVCHHGIRSMRVAMFLKSRDFADPINLTGGIDRWSLEQAPQIPRY